MWGATTVAIAGGRPGLAQADGPQYANFDLARGAAVGEPAANNDSRHAVDAALLGLGGNRQGSARADEA
jgi:hypothetical protein